MVCGAIAVPFVRWELQNNHEKSCISKKKAFYRIRNLENLASSICHVNLKRNDQTPNTHKLRTVTLARMHRALTTEDLKLRGWLASFTRHIQKGTKLVSDAVSSNLLVESQYIINSNCKNHFAYFMLAI